MMARRPFWAKTGHFNDEDVVDIILQQPACAQFISSKLYKFFVRRDLSAEVNEDLAAVLRTRSMNSSPCSKRSFSAGTSIRRPRMRDRSRARFSLWCPATRSWGLREAPGVPYLPKTIEQLGQAVGGPPNVAGWPGDKDGGTSWLNPSTLYQRGNVMRHLLQPKSAGRRYWQIFPPPNKEIAMKIAASGKGGEAMKMMNKGGKTMSPSAKKMMRNQTASNELGVYNAYVMIHERIKKVPLTGADIDLAKMIQDAGVTTAEGAIDYLELRFLRVRLADSDRAAVTRFLVERLGGDQIHPAGGWLNSPPEADAPYHPESAGVPVVLKGRQRTWCR